MGSFFHVTTPDTEEPSRAQLYAHAISHRVHGKNASLRANILCTPERGERGAAWVENTESSTLFETPSYGLSMEIAIVKLGERLRDRLIYFEGQRALDEFDATFHKVHNAFVKEADDGLDRDRLSEETVR